MENSTQKTVVVVKSTKSVGLAIVLSFFFGPLGMFYSTVTGAIIMLIANLLAFLLTAGLGLFITIPAGMIWAGVAASNHNKQLEG